MAEEQIKVTYEILFDFLRREKMRGELQELNKAFVKDVAIYLLEKCEMLNKENDQSKLFGEQEKLKTLNELANIKKIIRELFERRERKIIDLSLNKSRTNSSLITNTNLLPEERPFYESLLRVMGENRNNVLHTVLDTEKSKTLRIAPVVDDSIKTVKFVQQVAKFVGKELEPYGPYEPEDLATLPNEIAEILIQRGKAVESKT
jgi:DNA replication initiation complex subunit (GINS family)